LCRSQAQRLTADYFRFVTRRSGTGQQQWLGDVQVSLALFNWAHLYQCLRRCVSDDLYRSASTVELIEAMPHGTTLHLRPGGSLDFDLVVCADGYHSMGRRLIDPGATPHYRGMVLWRGLLHESDIRVDALDGDLQRVGYQGHGVVGYIPDPSRAPSGEEAFSCGLLPPVSGGRPLLDARRRSRAVTVRLGTLSGRCIRRSRRARPEQPSAAARAQGRVSARPTVRVRPSPRVPVSPLRPRPQPRAAPVPVPTRQPSRRRSRRVRQLAARAQRRRRRPPPHPSRRHRRPRHRRRRPVSRRRRA
jgi:hypothetical protein